MNTEVALKSTKAVQQMIHQERASMPTNGHFRVQLLFQLGVLDLGMNSAKAWAVR
jgi:hypothetical protein